MGEHGEICVYLRAGCSARETAQKVGCSVPLVYKVARLNGIRMSGLKSILDEKKDEIAKLTAMGEPYGEIARKYGTTRNTVRSFCRKNGIELTEEQKKKNIKETQRKNGLIHARSEDDVRRTINENHPDLVYVGGYKNSLSCVSVLCRKCGEIHETAYLLMTKKTEHRCPNCSKKKHKEQEEKRASERVRREEAKKQEAEQRKRSREEDRTTREQERIHACPVCGTITTRPIYCSNKCQKRAENKRHEIKRRMKVQKAMVDRDITLEGLYKRDSGICYICGRRTSLDDYITRDGTTICGDWYPSIDHVVPLAKGGEHSWRNVRLAHRICNSIKADEYAPTSGT